MRKNFENDVPLEPDFPEPAVPSDRLDEWQARIQDTNTRQVFANDISAFRQALHRLTAERKAALIKPVMSWMKAIVKNFELLRKEEEFGALFTDITAYFSRVQNYAEKLGKRLQVIEELNKLSSKSPVKK